MNQVHDWSGMPVGGQADGGRLRLPPSNVRTRLGAMPVLLALDWAFRRENVQLELPEREAPEERGFGFGMEYVLLQRARLGTTIDESGPANWGGSTPHEDAEVIAAIVSNMPDDLGGRLTAIRVAEYARAGLRPDWGANAKLKVVPGGESRRNQHGIKAAVEKIGRESYVQRGRLRSYDVEVCPIRFENDDRSVAFARATYTDWWFAISHVRRTLKRCGMLRQVSITDEMPSLAPWEKPRFPSGPS